MTEEKSIERPDTDPQDGNQRSDRFWKEVHERLEKSLESMTRGFQPAEEEQRKILKARAARLAQAGEGDRTEGERIEVLQFRLGSERYAFETSFINEVCPLKDLTPMPCTPGFVLGIINFHGQIVSVVDLQKFLNLPGEPDIDRGRVIILQTKGMEFGIFVDEIIGLRNVCIDGLQGSLATLPDLNAEFLKGVTQDCVAVLQAEKILTHPGIIVQDEMESLNITRTG